LSGDVVFHTPELASPPLVQLRGVGSARAQGCFAGGPSWHGQDAPGTSRGGLRLRAVFQRGGVFFRRHVCRCGCVRSPHTSNTTHVCFGSPVGRVGSSGRLSLWLKKARSRGGQARHGYASCSSEPERRRPPSCSSTRSMRWEARAAWGAATTRRPSTSCSRRWTASLPSALAPLFLPQRKEARALSHALTSD
jgi:hypothetical protein